MHQTTNRSARAVAVDFAQDIAHLWDDQLGQRLIGIYLIGSLARHGGYSGQRFSDIDIALIAEGPLESGEIDLVKTAKWRHVQSRLLQDCRAFLDGSIFCIGRFPPLDRVDYIDHAITVLERRHVRPRRPTLSEIRAYLSAEPSSKSGLDRHYF